MADFSSTLRINGNQMRDAVLQRTTAANQVADVTRRGQVGYSDTVEKILYFDGTTIQFVASENYVSSQITANTLTVGAASAAYLDITGNQITLKALAIQRVRTDVTSTTLAAALAARTPVYNAANVANTTADLQEGDILILSAATGGQQVYIHNGGTAGTVVDFTLMETPNLDTAAIRALFSGANGITYNPATGEFKLGGILTDANTTLQLSTNPNAQFYLANGDGTTHLHISNDTFSESPLYIAHAKGQIKLDKNGLMLNIIGAEAVFNDSRPNGFQRGLEYWSDYSAGFTARSLVDKGYVDGINIKRSTQTVTTVADTFLVITHNFALANPKSIQVTVWKGNVKTEPDIEVVDLNSIRIRTSQAETGLVVYMNA